MDETRRPEMRTKGLLRPDLQKTQMRLDGLPPGEVIIDQFGHAWQSGRTHWYRAYDGDGLSSFELAQCVGEFEVVGGGE